MEERDEEEGRGSHCSLFICLMHWLGWARSQNYVGHCYDNIIIRGVELAMQAQPERCYACCYGCTEVILCV